MENKNPLCAIDENPEVWLAGGEAALNLLLDSLPESHHHLVHQARSDLLSLATPLHVDKAV